MSIQEQESNQSKTLNKKSNEQTQNKSQSYEMSPKSKSLKKSARSHSLNLKKSNTDMLNEEPSEENE